MKISMLFGVLATLSVAGCYDCDSFPGYGSGAQSTTTAAGGEGGGGGSVGGEGGSGGASITCPFVSECAPNQAGPPFTAKSCEDGDDHTADRCADTHVCGGVCTHLVVECDGYDTPAKQAVVCDDANDCTADSCTADNHCAHAPTADNLPCSVGGICMQGVCTE